MYYAYRKVVAPTDIVTKYPQAAEYIDGAIIITGERSGLVAEDKIINLAPFGVQPDDGTEPNVMTQTQLLDKVAELLALEPVGREVRLSYEQGRFLYSVFKPEEITE